MLRLSWKTWYDNLTEDEKTSIIETRNIGFQSNTEKIVASILDENNIPYKVQKWVNRRSYDFSILGTRVLIEVQGDYWHCNPKIYKADDFVKFPSKNVRVSSIWKKDRLKLENAATYGYFVFYIWESDIYSNWIEKLKDAMKTHGK